MVWRWPFSNAKSKITISWGNWRMIARKEKAATLGLVPFIILIITLIGITFYYMTQLFGGNKQLLNGTDCGALGAARQLLAVGLQSPEVKKLPAEFQALGVDSTGTPTGL